MHLHAIRIALCCAKLSGRAQEHLVASRGGSWPCETSAAAPLAPSKAPSAPDTSPSPGNSAQPQSVGTLSTPSPLCNCYVMSGCTCNSKANGEGHGMPGPRLHSPARWFHLTAVRQSQGHSAAVQAVPNPAAGSVPKHLWPEPQLLVPAADILHKGAVSWKQACSSVVRQTNS